MNEEAPLVRRHVTVEGRVQGVGYRWFCRQAAVRLGVSGWVRNARDGRVWCEVQGDAVAVTAFVDQLRRGPPFARVVRATVEEVAVDRDAGDAFVIRP